jgi:hypothetical protein
VDGAIVLRIERNQAAGSDGIVTAAGEEEQ